MLFYCMPNLNWLHDQNIQCMCRLFVNLTVANKSGIKWNMQSTHGTENMEAHAVKGSRQVNVQLGR